MSSLQSPDSINPDLINAAAVAGSCADNLREFLLAAGRMTPDKPAIVEPATGGGLRSVTYRQLEQRVEQYVAVLEWLGLDVGDRVVVESNATASGVAALLGCCTLGLPFIPMSPDIPDKRLQTIMEIAKPALFLQAIDGNRQDIPPETGLGRFGPDGMSVERPPLPRTRYRRGVVGTDPAYIVFTSGTTGLPKGVVMSHRASIAFYRGARAEQVIMPDDRVAIAAPFHFDFCLAGIGLTLNTGGTAVPIPRDRLDWPRRFTGFLGDAEVTAVLGVPSIWRAPMQHEPDLVAGLDRLRLVSFSGEEFPLPELRELQRLLPGRRIVNAYGATESMAASFTEVPDPIPDDLERLSIGYAHPGAEMTICDAAGHPITEPGITGEIYLRSPGLFSGYWGDQEATGRALVPDPLNPASGQRVLRTGDVAYRDAHGELYFIGRVDSQVQIRGNRVELGEVERRILEFPGVAAAVCLLSPGRDGEEQLTAFVVLQPGTADVDVVALRAFCGQMLPDYMTPRQLRALTEFPVTSNGKVDRAELLARAVRGD